MFKLHSMPGPLGLILLKVFVLLFTLALEIVCGAELPVFLLKRLECAALQDCSGSGSLGNSISQLLA